jgi:hypothetical protein
VINIVIKRLKRNIHLAKLIDDGIILLLILILSKLPFFRRKAIYDKNRLKIKNKLIKENISVGHALSLSKNFFKFFWKKLIEKNLYEGLAATVEQFYFNRSLKYFENFVNSNSLLKKVLKNRFIFDPGCGCGKHLLYLKDKFNSKIFGVDIYKPAIEAAKIADYLNEGKFINNDSLDINFLKNNLTEKIDVLLIDSWLKHVMHSPNLDEGMNYIINKSNYALIIKSDKENEIFRNFFLKFEIIKQIKIMQSEIIFLNLKF